MTAPRSPRRRPHGSAGAVRQLRSTTAATGRTLPAAAYTSPEHYETECRQIFRKEWLLVASAEQLRQSGNWIAIDLVGEPIVVVRGTDGRVRALSAVCRHRYALLAEPGERGHAERVAGEEVQYRLSCPYHLWSYDLDGRLKSAPHMADVEGFTRDDHCLPTFPVEEWEGLIFVNLDVDPAPLAPRLEPVREAFARFGMSTARQVAFYNKVWPCSWHVAVENGSECYHHRGTHGELLEAVLPSRGTYGVPGGPGYARHHTPVAEGADWGIPLDGIDSGLLPADLAETVIFTIFPSTLVLSAGPLIGWFSFLPEGVGRCRFLNGFLAPATLVDAGVVDEAAVTQLMNTINDQDERIIRGVQRGVGSAHAQPGMLSHKEPALGEFYAWLRQALSRDTGHAPY